MKAYLKKSFKKGFLLSEENIIKLEDIILKRISEKKPDKKLTFKVFREDALVYETAAGKKILEEENSKRNLISKIQISYQDEIVKFVLAFDKKENTSLEIEADEKDIAYLLFSDIKDYLNTEVLKFRSFEFSELKYERILLPFLMVLFVILTMVVFQTPKLPKQELNNLLNSDSLNLKLNYLIEYNEKRTDIKNPLYTLGSFFILFIGFLFFMATLDKIFPRNIFYVGKEIQRYSKLCSRRSKFTSGILIALIISIIAGFVVYFFTK